MQPSAWGDVPFVSGLYYNNDREIGQILSRLLEADSQQDRLVIVESDSAGISDGALTHIAAVLRQIKQSETETFWYSAYPNSDFHDLGLALRRFLLQLWRKAEFATIRENDQVALSFELSGAETPKKYFDLNLAALSRKAAHSQVLIILDIQEAADSYARERLLELARLLVFESKWRRGIAVVPVGSVVGTNIRFAAPTGPLFELLNKERSGYAQTPQFPRTDELLADAVKVVHPLILLNQPVQRTVLDFILNHTPLAEQNLRNLLEQEALWRLDHDRIRLAPQGLSAWKERCRKQPAGTFFQDTVVNGAKILSFQGPDRLTEQVSGLKEIENMGLEATRIVDLFALAVSQKRFGARQFRDSIAEFVTSINDQRILLAGDIASRSLLCYASQLMLAQPAVFGGDLFVLLEQLTFGYADSIYIRHGSDSTEIYEASRWLTNLGYVYDQVSRVGRPGTTSARQHIYHKAASYINGLTSPDPLQQAELRYSEAWQMWDAGLIERSAQLFVDTANHLRAAVTAIDTTTNLFINFAVMELLIISISLHPTADIGQTATSLLTRMLGEEHASSLNLEKIALACCHNNVTIDGPPDPLQHDSVVIAVYSDLHVATFIAHVLRQHYRRTPQIVLVPGDNDFKYDLHRHLCTAEQAYASSCPHIAPSAF